ncbi:hypothetical protein AAFF39_03355 [Lactococcus garvieae]|uniref:hypothetical protein n=1 Tax=Lactococcus garvieae TaxID=1363 RepID=UPI002549CEE5|nr:hypothetical protein [Lactococcus garvieae]
MKTREILSPSVLGTQFRATGVIEAYNDMDYNPETKVSTIIKENAGIKIEVLILQPTLPNIARKMQSVKIKSEKYAQGIEGIAKELVNMPIVTFSDLKVGDYKGELWASASNLTIQKASQ